MSNLKKQFESFDQGQYINQNNQESWCFNFFDWFCDDLSLKKRADKLFRAAKKFATEMNIDMEEHYVIFKNNCPMSGSTYDDFRICEVVTGKVVYNVVPKRGKKSEVWSSENDFQKPIYIGGSLSEYYNN